MMIAVAVIAVVLAVEMFLFKCAARLVSSHDDHDYLLNEAVLAWVVLNVPAVGLTAPIVWACVKDVTKGE
jgi:hypothetical protein